MTIRAVAVHAAGSWPLDAAADHIQLTHDERHRRRFRFTARGGTDFLLDLPQAISLRHGDGLELSDGRFIAVEAANEDLMEVTAADATALLRLAWHIGNRHLPAELAEHCIRLRDDHVIADMLHGLGATVRHVRVPFMPEGGAYAGHGAAQEHHHHHGHDHGHRHPGGEHHGHGHHHDY
jgi:urease accessory protein